MNMLNLLWLEFGRFRELYGEHLHEQLGTELEPLDEPSARSITTGTALLLVCVSFVEAQLNFFLLHRSQRERRRRRQAERKARQMYAGNEQSTDLEYVIPKVGNPIACESCTMNCISNINLLCFHTCRKLVTYITSTQ